MDKGEKATSIKAPVCHQTQTFYWKQAKSSNKRQQQEQRRCGSIFKHIKENLHMKKSTFKQTRLFQAKMFPGNGMTGQIKQSSRDKSLTRQEIR